jgi:hypothetical protein
VMRTSVNTSGTDEEMLTRQAMTVGRVRGGGRTATFSIGQSERTYNPDRDREPGGKPRLFRPRGRSSFQAQNTVEDVLLAHAQPSHFIMAPRQWNWFTAAVSSSWPVIAGTNVPSQSWAVNLTKECGPKVRAELPNGMLVTVDANVSTVCLGTALTGGTQDQVYAVAADECHLWEDANSAVLLRCEQPSAASLGVLFVAQGYFAYSMRRYTGASVVVNGTGWACLRSCDN